MSRPVETSRTDDASRPGQAAPPPPAGERPAPGAGPDALPEAPLGGAVPATPPPRAVADALSEAPPGGAVPGTPPRRVGHAAGPRGAQAAGQRGADLLSARVRARIRQEVAEAGGAEVALYGRVDAAGLVVEVEVAARGHMSAAPAVLARADGQDVAIHNHPSGDLRPSGADLEVASLLAERGLGFLIVTNDAERAYAVVPFRPAPALAPVGAEEVEAFLGRGGPIARVLGPAYEPRPGQARMSRAVADALNHDAVASLESGTGTGKTFAYLVPAALFALRNREKVVVSTATINLQEQIARKDVPNLLTALATARAAEAAAAGRSAPGPGSAQGERGPDVAPAPPLSAVVVKGRGNYVSLRRAEEAAAQEQVAFGAADERAEVLRLSAWARVSASGDKAELSPPPSGDAWEHVASQADNCLGIRCPRFGDCHYYAARRAASRAQIVIVNHHLLFADLAIKLEIGFDEAAVLPPFRRVVLDEAHHAEAIASDYFGAQATERGLAHPRGRLQRRRDASRGVLPALARALLGAGAPGAGADPGVSGAARLARTVDEELGPLRERVGLELEGAFAQAAQDVRAALPHEQRGQRDAKLRLLPEHRDLFAPLAPAAQGLALLAARLTRLGEEVPGALAEGERGRLEPLLLQLRAAARRLERGAATLTRLLREEDGAVRWAELSRDFLGRERLTLRAAPLDVAPLLRKALFEPARTVVLSSATLTVRGSFAYLEGRLGLDGLDPARLRRDTIPSPFDFPRQALLGVPAGIPLPTEPGYADAVAGAVRALVSRSRGRAFVLFTSYGALGAAYRALEADLVAAGLTPLRQGSESRDVLLRRFRGAPGAVLFGTDSFWEGVDVPGDGLVLVVIARLPFSVPSEPVQEARAEAIARRGGDPFRELQLPRAVLKLTQGFGRLIRTARDRGAVVVLDRRLLVRPYGREFLESLPRVRIEARPLPQLLEALEPYVGSQRGRP